MCPSQPKNKKQKKLQPRIEPGDETVNSAPNLYTTRPTRQKTGRIWLRNYNFLFSRYREYTTIWNCFVFVPAQKLYGIMQTWPKTHLKRARLQDQININSFNARHTAFHARHFFSCRESLLVKNWINNKNNNNNNNIIIIIKSVFLTIKQSICI